VTGARKRGAWVITVAAAAILMATMGARQSLGLFISPLKSSTGFGITTISLALAIAQLMWGVIQPVSGAIADRYGPSKILIAGLLLLALGMALTPFMTSGFGLIVSLGVLAAAGSGAGSFSVLIGAASRHLPAEKRGKAAGIINAGGSLGQFVFAPVAQLLIQMLGWMGAMWSLALITLGALPLVRVVSPAGLVRADPDAVGSSPWLAVRSAMEDRSYLLLHAGFFTCGFHIAFLVTHLPGEVNLCGLPPVVASWSLALIGLANIVGSLIAGACTQRFRSKYILAAMYASRALLIGWYLFAPKNHVDILWVCHWLGPHLAGHGAAHRHHRRQALRHPVFIDAVRPDAALTSDRWFSRRISWRSGACSIRRLSVDVVHRYGPGGRCGPH
jgi:predicted MFS family arabinose efflux permease